MEELTLVDELSFQFEVGALPHDPLLPLEVLPDSAVDAHVDLHELKDGNQPIESNRKKPTFIVEIEVVNRKPTWIPSTFRWTEMPTSFKAGGCRWDCGCWRK